LRAPPFASGHTRVTERRLNEAWLLADNVRSPPPPVYVRCAVLGDIVLDNGGGPPYYAAGHLLMDRESNMPVRAARIIAAWLFIAVVYSNGSARADPRVLIVSIDGLRPDVALRADMPNLRRLMNDGSFTFLATTTPAAVTLPSHTSMLTGVTIERHGISGNDDEAASNEKLLVPTIFDLAKAAGVSSGMASGKSKFSLYDPPIDHFWQPEPRAATKVKAGKVISYSAGTVVSDEETADHAVQIITQFRPRLMFVHFGRNDSIGHGIGWGTAAQVDGLAKTDQDLGRVLDALRSAGVFDQTDVILSADHGGAGRAHGATVEGSKYIPWIIAGPGVRKNVDLTVYRDWPVRTYDTFATACKILGLQYPADIDGRPVDPAFESFKSSELLGPTTRRSGTVKGGSSPPSTKPSAGSPLR
jgi:hypothetical protein